MERKLDEVEKSENRTTVSFKTKEPNLLKLNESDDVEHFLTTFVRIATANKWPEDISTLKLALLLSGKAQAVNSLSLYIYMER